MKIVFPKEVYDTDDNEEFLKFLLRSKAFHFKNKAQKELIRQILAKIGYSSGVTEIVIMCKKCKGRYRSFTDSAKLHCNCDSMYYKSDGRIVTISAPRDTFEILLINPDTHAINSNAGEV